MLAVLASFPRYHRRSFLPALSTSMADGASAAATAVTQKARSKAADRNSGLLQTPVRRQLSSGDSRPPPDLNIASQLAGFGGGSRGTAEGATSVPIFQTATFDCRTQDEYDYTRSGNPTRGALEELCRNIEHAHRAFAFSTGMAALMATVQVRCM
jgi:cystathionine beta-lyase/cystathionine gamma-synthase